MYIIIFSIITIKFFPKSYKFTLFWITPFPKINSNFQFNFILNRVEFSITFVLSDHPPGIVVELQFQTHFHLLTSITTSYIISSLTWVWPSSAPACLTYFVLCPGTCAELRIRVKVDLRLRRGLPLGWDFDSKGINGSD